MGHPADTNGDGVISPEERAAWLAANPGKTFESGWQNGGGNGLKTPWGTVHAPNLTGDPTADAQRANLNAQGGAASGFADQGQQGYGAMTEEAKQARDYLRALASGQNSVSAEQLRQGNQQTLSAQRSMAASASPQNGPMAALAAAQNMNRASMGLAGQQAVAGLAERNAAQQGLADMILKQRQQDAQVALDSRGNAISGYGGAKPAGSTLDKYGNVVVGTLGAIAKFSDKRLKHEINDGDDDANATLKGLRAFTYKYKDKALGKDRELGVMAQDLENAGLKHTIIETPRGKAVHGGALATANTAMLAALEKRVSKMEGGK
jgi:hypothetical protein